MPNFKIPGALAPFPTPMIKREVWAERKYRTSLASSNLKNCFRRFVPHIVRNNNQFSTP